MEANTERKSEWFVYIPNEGDWSITTMANGRPIHDEKDALLFYLEWAERKRIPNGAVIWEQIQPE